jgi:pimeloyl-ACP methyl ester carboxylesterase
VALTAAVERWRSQGRTLAIGGRDIHVFRREGADPVLVLLHGFPSSSYDWRRLLDEETEQAVLAFDFLGFGLSEKPAGEDYGLFRQADLAEQLIQHEFPGRPCFLVAHDMGTSVATELMARDLEGRLNADVVGALLFNGSIVLELAQPTLGQKLLRTRAAPLFARLMNEPFFRRQFASLFSSDHPLDPAEATDQWSLLANGGGHRQAHRLIVYMDERDRYAERWHGAFRDWPKSLHLLWGMRDPVAVPAVLERLRNLRPGIPVTELAQLGHYPQIEDPARIAMGVKAALREPDRRGEGHGDNRNQH